MNDDELQRLETDRANHAAAKSHGFDSMEQLEDVAGTESSTVWSRSPEAPTRHADDATQVRADLISILGYTCETQAPNKPPTLEYVTDRWMKPRLDALVEYVQRSRQERS